ncbi:hypothetical protein PTI98_002082 [Pleurotus ostreatus]|nr:hypothetical protein PTI98_002082 [Pleurotus ostreatus]
MAPHHHWSMKHVELNTLRRNVVDETQGHYIVSMDPNDFLHEFLPWNNFKTRVFRAFKAQKPSAERINHLIAMGAKTEREMYGCFNNAFSGWPDALGAKCRNINFHDTHNYRDSFSGLGPDCVIDDQEIVRRRKKLKVDFANLLSFVEFKVSELMDAFIDVDGEEYSGKQADSHDADEEAGGDEVEEEDDNLGDIPDAYTAEDEPCGKYNPEEPETDLGLEDDAALAPSKAHPSENDSIAGADTRGQIASYAGVAMAMQFRSHLFSVLICGRYARFIRWDRSCAIVSRRFDYTVYPEILFEFYHRFAQLTKYKRGLLPNFKTLRKEDGETALKAFERFAKETFEGQDIEEYKLQAQLRTRSMLRMEYKGERYAVPTPSFDGGMYSPFGRLTRNRPVVRLLAQEEKCEVLYFKEYWREHSDFTEPESRVYELISKDANLSNNPHFATMRAGGDIEIEGQPVNTIGHEYADSPWVVGEMRVRKLTAHFIILSTIGRDLRTFRSARDLVSCIADAMEAHQLAYDVLNILHRDISAGNILMSTQKPPRGILIDWDHCIFMDKLTKDRETRVKRTGTWQFMSAHLAANPKTAPHSLVDDRESALHVLMYLAIKYLRHNKGDHYCMRDLLSMFDDFIEKPGNPHKQATTQKSNVIKLKGPDIVFDLKPINQLIKKLCTNFAARYENPENDSDSEDEDAGQLKRTRSNRLSNLKKKDWLYSEFRKFAAKLPEPQGNETDHVHNSKHIQDVRQGQGKRGREDDLCDGTDGSKLAKPYDILAFMVNAKHEASAPPDRKRQCTGK